MREAEELPKENAIKAKSNLGDKCENVSIERVVRGCQRGT